MYKLRYQIARVRNIGAAWFRTTKLYLTPSRWDGKNHLQFEWKMNSIHDVNFGRAIKYFELEIVHTDPSWHRDYRYTRRETIGVARDRYDQLLDTIVAIITSYWKNMFQQAVCSHPHERVWIEWDGEHEYGYTKQHVCSKCQGYLASTDLVDRYLPSHERHPEKIGGDHVHPFDLKPPARVHDSVDDMHFEDDYIR